VNGPAADASYVLCENLVKIFKVEDVEVVALQGLDLSVREREMIAIIGPSGSGKSSLLNLLGGLDKPSAGRIRVAGRDLVAMSDAERTHYRRKSVGFVWQNVARNLIPYLSAVENVELPMILSGVFSRKRAHLLLELVGLGHRKHHRPGRMSGGEQQRVAIAIALANSPSLLLADEPTGSLDRENTGKLLDVFDSVRNELGVTVVVVTHDRTIARAVDRYVEIRDGKTSSEAVRKDGGAALPTGATYAAGAASDAARQGGPEDTHEHFTLLDSAGRLQVPPDLLASHGIKGRVKLIEVEGRIVIVPEESDPADGTGD
jgi:ABC-type lipoprotein export system ATPase subunit